VTAGQRPVFAADDDALNAVISTEFAPARDVYLPIESKWSVAAKPSSARVLGSRFSTHRAEIELEAPAASMVVISQAYSHLWRAYVDGQKGRIWRANYAFQAVEVPAGRHQIRLRYCDPFFKLGAGLSAMILAGLFFVAFRQTRRPAVAMT